jgi:hypothetical protein
MDYYSSVDLWAGCVGLTAAQCRDPSRDGSGTKTRDSFAAKSDFITQQLPPAAVQAMIDGIEQRQQDSALTASGGSFYIGTIQLDSWGGALNQPAADATAFVHRDARCHAQYLAYWANGAPAAVADANVAWLNAFRATLAPYLPGSSYVNYIDPDLSDWQNAYYGANLTRLRQVKRTWDPDNFFHFAQSIPPA